MGGIVDMGSGGRPISHLDWSSYLSPWNSSNAFSKPIKYFCYPRVSQHRRRRREKKEGFTVPPTGLQPDVLLFHEEIKEKNLMPFFTPHTHFTPLIYYW